MEQEYRPDVVEAATGSPLFGLTNKLLLRSGAVGENF
jgi:hypothetical protein